MSAVAPFALRLRQLRKRQGISQVQLAASAGVTQQCVSLLEAGDREPGIDTVIALALALECKPSWLAFGEGQTPDLRRVA